MTQYDVSPKDVLLHPLEYTVNGTIEEIEAFLEGYNSGKYAHRPGCGNEVAWWSDFCQWALLRIRGTGQEMRSYRLLFVVLREMYGDDATIRDVILRLLDDFQNTGTSAPRDC
jgi:hypothetical protein